MADVAMYVQESYDRQSYSSESYDVRAWPGAEMVKDAIVRQGIEVGYAGAATVADFDVILVPIVSANDWWSFLRERMLWPPGSYTVIIGGSGVTNIRPFLEYADVFVFGRGENVTPRLVGESLSGNRLKHESVCWADEFSADSVYKIAQASCPYEHEYCLANGKAFTESTIGCRHKCLFCHYSWSRRHVGSSQAFSGASRTLWPGAERALLDMDLTNPGEWNAHGMLRTVGIDGFSQRLRYMANKPISDAKLKSFLCGLRFSGKPHRVKLYNLVGLPTEGSDDLAEMHGAIRYMATKTPAAEKKWCIDLQNNHFKAVPSAPVATWPVSYVDYRGRTLAGLREISYTYTLKSKYEFFDSDSVWGITDTYTEGLARVALEMLVLRGEESDASVVRKIALSKKFWRAGSAIKLSTIEKYLDIDRLFGACTWEDLPTRYLHSYVPQETMARLGSIKLRRYGGDEGSRLADYIDGASKKRPPVVTE